MKKTTTTTILLIASILLLLNVISQNLFHRFDLTADKQYTLSNATKDILTNLENPVTVTAYFSEDLPPNLQKLRKDFQDMLVEYSNTSRNMVDYQFINPNESPEKEQEAGQSGIQPVMINIREKDQSKQQRAFLGAILKMGEQQDVIPVIASAEGMEYSLSTSIKKMAVINKPVVGIVQGHGEPSLQELGQVYQSLSILYAVEPVDLSSPDLSRFKAIAMVAPKDTILPNQLSNLDTYLSGGGSLFLGVNRVEGNLQNQTGSAVNTGLETWLAGKGINVEPSFILDVQCGTVTVQQRQGFFMMNTPVQFPYLPLINQFPDHPITKGLDQVILPFASPVSYSGSGTFTPFLQSSAKSASSPAPTTFQVVDKKWTDNDFTQSNLTIGGILEQAGSGRIIVIGDGDFPVSGQGRGQSQDNISLMVNGIDFLSDDTGLIELRTKGVATRPISEDYIGDENAGKRNTMKYLNFGLPILLILLYGFLRSQRARNTRIRRLQEDYS
ncbi:MAG: Gldg family protein [Bacteroidota bacterium]